MAFIDIQGHRLEYELIRAPVPRPSSTLVFLHEGLGSLSMWKDFPERMIQASGCNALVYSRYGYGQSDALAAPRRVDFMHDEALESLPELLDKLHIDRPILFGHSDGASIALIYAGGSGRDVGGLILMAPHVMVEDLTIKNILMAKHSYRVTDLPTKLARYHANVDSAFRGWNDIWLAPEFRRWNIEEYLPRIDCPILAIQGEDDEYGTMEQITRIERGARDVETLKLPNCGHSPQRDQPQAVIEAATRFVRRVTGGSK